ncbi:RHS repeat-associated core domain-containing protein, partial [Lachnotalea glycerini]|uniref:RHS repeat-associated core domain-containing protein n=1 Tax=Lachnotalea glycerini TaxID=1763509 RepID=UPI001FA83DCC
SDILLASDAESAKTYYHYASDEMGSITHVTEQDEVLNRYEYDAWGNVTESEERVENRFQFNGQQLDPISQQYYLRARYYNPVIGRFTQEDTYRGDGLNLYAYCANNPVSYVDPSGNQCKAAKDRLAASTSKGKNETKTSTKLTEHQDSSSKGSGDTSRKEALGQIKQDLGIPKTQQPVSQKMEKMLDEHKKPIVVNGEFVYSRELTYSVSGKTDAGGNPIKQVIIQDHSYGHSYSDGIGNQSSHFNVRPDNNPKTGGVNGTKEHYYFTYRNKK